MSDKDTSKERGTGSNAVLAVGLVLVTLAPVAVLAIAGLDAALLAAVLGGLTGMIAGVVIGGRFAVGVAIVMAVAQFFSYIALSNAIAAGVVMGITALLYGLVSRRGATAAVVTFPIAILITITAPPEAIINRPTSVTALVVAIGALIGCLWGAVPGVIVGRRITRPVLGGLSVPSAWIYAVTLAIVAGGATAFVVARDFQKGGEWLVLTIFIVVQPSVQRTWEKLLHRIGGTAGGFVIVAIVSVLTDSSALLYFLSIAFMVSAVVVKIESRPYWQYVLMLTPSVVIAEGATTDLLELDVVRLEFTLLGALISFAVLFVFRFIDVRLLPRAQGSAQ